MITIRRTHRPELATLKTLPPTFWAALRIDVDRDDFPVDANRNYGIPFDTAESPGNPFRSGDPGSYEPNGR